MAFETFVQLMTVPIVALCVIFILSGSIVFGLCEAASLTKKVIRRIRRGSTR